MKLFGWNDTKRTPYFITPFTLMHFLSGVIANLVSRKIKISYICGFTVWFFIHLLYECKDYYFSYVKKGNSYENDNSLFNSVGDQLFAVLGFILGEKISLKFLTPIIIFILIFVTVAYLRKVG